MKTLSTSNRASALYEKLGFADLPETAVASETGGALGSGWLDPEKLESSPIRKEWILEGEPEARCLNLSGTTRGWASTSHWSCTAGKFEWHFGCDETVLFVEGEAFITDEAGVSYHAKPGVSLFFPKGSSSVWEVPVYIRKMAFCYRPIPLPFHFAMRVADKFCRVLGIDKDPSGGL